MFTTIAEGLKFIQNQFIIANTQNKEILYVPLSGRRTSSMQDDVFDLRQVVQQFLNYNDENNKKIAEQQALSNNLYTTLLLLGDMGSGKSLFCEELVQILWQNFKMGDPIPLLISLPGLQDPLHRAIDETLENYGFSIDQISELKKVHRFIFILDGYDEIHQLQNLTVTNHLEEWKAKTIITCRSQYLYHVADYEKYFIPFERNRRRIDLFQRLWIAPFSEEQVATYIQQYQKQSKVNNLIDLYEQLMKIPGLQELMLSPFLLKLAIENLPSLKESFQKQDKEQKLTQAALYDIFIENWFKRQEKKLQNSGHLQSNVDMKPQFWQYCKSLALAFREEGISYAIYQPSNKSLFTKQSSSRWDAFFSTEPHVALLRSACPIIQIGKSQYGFMHASFIEYFTTRAMYEEELISSTQEVKTGNINLKSEVAAHKKELPTICRTLFSREPEMLRNIADRILENQSFKKRMFQYLELSKKDESYAVAAANAISALNKARIAFSKMDLMNIRIKGANLEGVIMDQTDLRNSDAREVYMRGAWLKDSDWRGAKMEGIDFDENPFVKLSDPIIISSLSDNDNLLNVVFKNNSYDIYEVDSRNNFKKKLISFKSEGDFEIHSVAMNAAHDIAAIVKEQLTIEIELWKISSGVKDNSIKLPKGHYPVYISISPNGNKLAIGCKNGVILLWSIIDNKFLTSLETSMAIDTGDGIVFNSSSNLLVSKHKDNFYLWDLNTNLLIHIFKRKENEEADFVINDSMPKGIMAFSLNDEYLVFGVENVEIWSVKEKALFRTFQKGNRASCTCVAISHDNQFLISGFGSAILIGDVETGKWIDTLNGHKDEVSALIFSSDGKQLISSSIDGTVRHWDIEQWTKANRSEQKDIKIQKIVFNPEGSLLALIHGNLLSLWSTHPWQKLRSFVGDKWEIRDACFSPDGCSLAIIGSFSFEVHLFSINEILENGKTIFKSFSADYHCSERNENEKTFSIHLTEETFVDRNFAKIARDHFNITNQHKHFSGNDVVKICKEQIVEKYGEVNIDPGYSLRNVILTDRYLIVRNSDKSEHIWDLRKNANGMNVYKCSSPDNTDMPCHSQMNVDRLFSFISPGKNNLELGGESYLLLKPNSQTILLITKKLVWDKESRLVAEVDFTLIDLLDGSVKSFKIDAITSSIRDVIFSADGEVLAISYDKNLLLWSMESMKTIKIYKHNNSVMKLSISPANRYLILCDSEGIIIWKSKTKNIEDAQPFCMVRGLTSLVKDISWRQKNDQLFFVSVTEDGIARHWQILDNEPNCILQWVSDQCDLVTQGLKFNEKNDLSEKNKILLKQKNVLLDNEVKEIVESIPISAVVPSANNNNTYSERVENKQNEQVRIPALNQFQNQKIQRTIKVNAETLKIFLRLVAEGEQDKAEEMLKSNQEFALASGDITDLAGGSFKGITAFQYAMWALDWHMWTMIRKYLPNDKVREQLQNMANSFWVKQHGVSASWQSLLDALQKTIDLCKASKWSEADTQWNKGVGAAQKFLPAHVINEYCRPDRPFHPCPDFSKDSTLPRSRKTSAGEWHTAYESKLGETFAYYRYSNNSAGVADGTPAARIWASGYVELELKACRTLLNTRVQQRDQLLTELSSVNETQLTSLDQNNLIINSNYQRHSSDNINSLGFHPYYSTQAKPTNPQLSLTQTTHQFEQVIKSDNEQKVLKTQLEMQSPLYLPSQSLNSVNSPIIPLPFFKSDEKKGLLEKFEYLNIVNILVDAFSMQTESELRRYLKLLPQNNKYLSRYDWKSFFSNENMTNYKYNSDDHKKDGGFKKYFKSYLKKMECTNYILLANEFEKICNNYVQEQYNYNYHSMCCNRTTTFMFPGRRLTNYLIRFTDIGLSKLLPNQRVYVSGGNSGLTKDIILYVQLIGRDLHPDSANFSKKKAPKNKINAFKEYIETVVVEDDPSLRDIIPWLRAKDVHEAQTRVVPRGLSVKPAFMHK